MADVHQSWSRVDIAVDWLTTQLGPSFVAAVDDAETAIYASLSDGERDRVAARHSELARALAALRRRDRRDVVPVLPSEEHRAVSLAMLARLCWKLGVEGLQDRVATLRTADDVKYRSTQFEIECAAMLARDRNNAVAFVPDDVP